ncbi:MAG: 6,7-dimethyl-8-ribityllumazine synthase [bacterium]|nr:6,7-dimethyl-8-ribityllumazine synthase [bacterium]MCP4968266.1 6,7-dimethyl-8-ribityllumazine synthase [bacterium]
MSEEIQELQPLDANGLRIAVARSRFNHSITSRLAAGAVDYLESAGADFEVYDTPGAFELPLISARLLEAGYDAVVAIGAVIDGDTDHYEHVAGRASEGLMKVSLETGKPVAFGILTVREREQAEVRSKPGAGNKGAEAAAAAVETALLLRELTVV